MMNPTANNYWLPLTGESLEMGPARTALVNWRISHGTCPVFDRTQAEFWNAYWSNTQTQIIREHMKALGIKGSYKARYMIVPIIVMYWHDRIQELVTHPARKVTVS